MKLLAFFILIVSVFYFESIGLSQNLTKGNSAIQQMAETPAGQHTGVPSKMACTSSSCAAPVVIGALVDGVTQCVDECNTGSPVGPNFVGNNCYDFPDATAFFEITTGPTTATLEITINSIDLTNPYFYVFGTADCLNYTLYDGNNCYVGAAGSVTGIVDVPVNTTLLIAVSDDNGLEGDFTICVETQPDLSACNVDNELVVTNTSLGSPLTGPYLPGEVVSYCYSINQYTQANCNWLQGIVPEFGDCWDAASFDANGQPITITTPLQQEGNFGTGGWDWWVDGDVQYNTTGVDVGSGWFFVNSAQGPSPNDSWGDGNGMGPNGSCEGATSGLSWSVCFDLIVRTDCENGFACDVSFKTYSDGEIGIFNNLGCATDIATFQNATLVCCLLQVEAGANAAVCSPGSINLNGSFINNDGPANVTWTASPVAAEAGLSDPNILNPTFTPPPGLSGPVTFTLSVTDDACTIVDVVTITVNTTPIIDPIIDEIVCDSYVLPGIAGSNLTGSQAYYTGPNGTGVQYLPGSTINFGDFGAYPVTLYAYDETGTTPNCFDEESFALTIIETPTVALPAFTGVCINEGIQSLGGGTVTGGVYSGTGVTDDGNGTSFTFDPLVAGVGVHTITYTVTTLPNPPACSDFATNTLEVYALPALTFTAINDLCINAGVQAGSGATPIGGVYSGPGVTDNGNGSTYSFDPLSAGVGVHTITYTYTDGNSCTNSITDDVEVFPTPVLNFPALAGVCLNAGVQAGIGAATVTGGVYSGAGVTDDGNGSTFSFDPIAVGVGVHVITYTFTDANSCTTIITQNIEVFPTPVLNFPALADVCLNAGVQSGIGAATVTGGVYSGTGVTDDGNGSTFSFDPIAAGVGVHIITYTVTDANSCTASITQTIEVVDAPTISGTFDVCVGLTTSLTGSGTPNATAPWTSSNTAVATVDVNGVVTGVSGGTVTITYTDDNGCTAQETITVNALPVITLVPNNPSGCGLLDGSIDVNGAGSGTITWSGIAAGSSPGALSFNIPGLGAGGYSVTFTDGTTGCISATVNTNLNDPGAPIINPIANYTACEVDYVIPDPLVGITGTDLTNGQAYYSAPGGNVADLLPQGTIITSAMSPMTVYAYDNNGLCDSEVSFVVNVNTNPTALVSPDPASACAGTAIPLNGNPAGGSGVYSINTWTGDISILNATNVVNPTVLAAATPGVYNLTYTVTDNNGCIGTDDIQVTINAVPVLSGTQEVCVGLTTTINSTGTPDAVTPWTSSNTAVATVDDFGVVTGVAGGTATITFLDANGCSNTISVTVNANPVISLTPTDPTVCNGTDGFITVNGAGNGTIDWSGDAIGSDSPVNLPYNITGLSAGNYNVIFTDANGCISNNPATTLNNPNAPVIDPISDTTSCAINFVVPDAATYVTGTFLTGNQEFYDQPGGNIADLVAAGTVITAAMSPLTLYVYDINGACDAEVSFVVTINQNPTTVISPLPAELCAGLALQLNGNPLGGSGVYTTHEWTNTGATSLDFTNIVDPTFSNAVAGAYDLTYTVTDDNGCIGTSNIQVTVNPNPTATISPVPAEVCAGIDLQLNGNPAGGSAVYTTHAWTNTGSTSLDFTNIENPLFNNVTAGNYDLTYTVTDDNGCVGSDNIIVVVNENPTATITPDPASTCAGIDLQLDGGPLGGSGVYSTHLWSNTGSTSLDNVNIQNPLFNNVTPGNYDLTYTVTDDNGCVGTSNIVVTVTGNPTSLISPDPAAVCAGQDIQLNGNPVGGTSPYASHDWTNTGSTSLNFTNIVDPLFNNVAAGTYDLTYTVTDDNGCIGTDNITVTVVASPVIDPLGPIVACDSYALPGITGVDLTGNQAYFNDTQANAGTVVTGPITSSTTLYMYDGAAGCSDEVLVNITINALPEVSTITGDGSYCENEVPVDVLVETVGTPDWTVYFTLDGVSQSATGSISPINLGNLEGTYVLDSISDLNCSNTATGSVVIDIKPTPGVPSAGNDSQYCSTVDFADMFANGAGGTMTWYTDLLLTEIFGTGNAIQPANQVGATSYYVTETIDGCEGPSNEVVITIENCDIILPTAFTPDNDGNNDTWEIPLLDEAYPNNVVYVYNRWGSLIFEHNSQDNGPYNANQWDGTYNGNPLPVGSYFFVIDFNNVEQESATGAVSIILN